MDNQSAHILVVDDEEPLLKDLDVTLREAGYTTTLAEHGKEALTLLKGKTFDAVLLDLVMPHEDGFQVLAAMRRVPGAPPIIVTSNLAHPEDIARAKALGAREYFVKAVHLPNIVNHVNGVLASAV